MDSGLDLFVRPNGVNWVSQVIMLANKVSDWNFFDIPKRNEWDDGWSISLRVFFVTSVIELFVNSCFEGLTVVNNLLKRSAWARSTIYNFWSCCVVPRTTRTQKIWNVLADIWNVRAEFFKALIIAWALNFISIEERECWFGCSPVVRGWLDHSVWRISCIDDWSKS